MHPQILTWNMVCFIWKKLVIKKNNNKKNKMKSCILVAAGTVGCPT